MAANGLLQLAIYLVVLLALVKPRGWYMACIYEGENVGINWALAPVERLLYRLFGTHENEGMRRCRCSRPLSTAMATR